MVSHTKHQERQNQFHEQQGQGPLSPEMTSKPNVQFQCRRLQEGFRRILWSDSKDSKYRNCNSTSSLIHNRSWCGNFDSKIKLPLVLIIRRKLCYGSKKWKWLILLTSENLRDQFYGKDFPNSEMQDAKSASALNKIIQNSDFKEKISLKKQTAQKKDPFLRGRQIAFMICDYFRVTDAHDTVEHCADLFSVTLHEDNIQEFDTRWDEVLLSMSKFPSDDILESLYKMWIRESDQLKIVLEFCDMKNVQKISMPNYQKLKTMVKRSIDQKLRLRNFDARHGRIETGAVVKSRKGLSGVEGGKGACYQWKEKGQCSNGDQCSFRHESDDRAPKTKPKAATPSKRDSGILLTDFACAYFSVNHYWIFHFFEKEELPIFIRQFLRAALRVVFGSSWRLILYTDGFATRPFPAILLSRFPTTCAIRFCR